MTYSVKEIFPTLQGEGAQAGRRAVFCRFTGCNLWNGLERDRATSVCKICDTDFVGIDPVRGGKFPTAQELAERITRAWNEGLAAYEDKDAHRYVIFTGGEPLLQLDAPLIEAIKARGFEIGVETNGTIGAPEGIDWICVSPKTPDIVQRTGSEMKLLYPLADVRPEMFQDMAFGHFCLQPIDVADKAAKRENIKATIAYCMARPQWRLSVQTHKIVGIE